MKHWLGILILVICLLSAGCDMQKMADDQFGDQHFKTAVALIELHKLRNGQYPDRLSDINFTGSWDGIALNSVYYEKLDIGYRLDLSKGWVSQPELEFPVEFWHGLGVVQTNVGRAAK